MEIRNAAGQEACITEGWTCWQILLTALGFSPDIKGVGGSAGDAGTADGTFHSSHL